jgi:hypothetical protein
VLGGATGAGTNVTVGLECYWGQHSMRWEGLGAELGEELASLLGRRPRATLSPHWDHHLDRSWVIHSGRYQESHWGWRAERDSGTGVLLGALGVRWE